MEKPRMYDVFLCYAPADTTEIEALARRLCEDGLKPFLDKWDLIPGTLKQESVEAALESSRTCAVFTSSGLESWQNEEMRVALDRRAKDSGFRVIPVLLPGAAAPDQDRLPPFLRRIVPVDFRAGFQDGEAYGKLLQGIHGEHAPEPVETQSLEQHYRERLIRWLEHIPFQRLIRDSRSMELPLERLYVDLRLVAEVPEGADTPTMEMRQLLATLEEGDTFSNEEHRERKRQYDEFWREHLEERALPERRTIGEALKAAGQAPLVVLGDPGCGKTTLLKYLALTYARGPEHASAQLGLSPDDAGRLPVYMPLAMFEDLRRRRGGLTLKEFLAFYYEDHQSIPGLTPLIADALASGRAILLFDGLDEVADVRTRQYLAEHISAFMREWTPKGVRFVITSRIIGYRDAPISGAGSSTFMVPQFGDREIEIFVRQWVQIVEECMAGGPGPEAEQRALALENALMRDVRCNPGVRRLAANPLMLSILALLRRQRKRPLPQQRIQLYRRYTDTLLKHWPDVRTPGAREESHPLPDPQETERSLVQLALWLGRHRPSGTAGPVEICRFLTDYYLAEEGLDRAAAQPRQLREAEAKAGQVFHEAREVTGLLVERDYDAFGFLHRTFQEYFAGRALAGIEDAEARWSLVRRHLHDPGWHEPLTLCAGWMGVVENRRQEATRFVQRILEHEDPAEGYLHRNLLKALRIASDDVGLKKDLLARLESEALDCLAPDIGSLRKDIIASLAWLAVYRAIDAREIFPKVFALSDGSHFRQQVIRILQPLAFHEDIWSVLWERRGKEEGFAYETLLAALANHIEQHPDIMDRFLNSLKSHYTQDKIYAAKALSVQAGNPSIRSALLESIHDPWSGVRKIVVESLSGEASDPRVRAALTERTEDNDSGVRTAAIIALSDQVGHPSVRDAIVEQLRDGDGDAANALALLIEDDTEVRELLLKQMTQRHWHFRIEATNALCTAIAEYPEVRDAVIERLDDDHEVVRLVASRGLSQSFHRDGTIRDELLMRIREGKSDIVHGAIDELAKSFNNDSEIRALFGEWARSPRPGTRERSAKALGDGALPDSPKCLTLLCDIQHNMTSPSASRFTEFVIAELAPLEGNSAVRERLLHHVTDPVWGVRREAIKALSHTDIADSPDVLSAVKARLADDNEQVRVAAIAALGPVAYRQEAVRDQLLELITAEEGPVAITAVRALEALVSKSAVVRNSFVRCLRSGKASAAPQIIRCLSEYIGTDRTIREAIMATMLDGEFSNRIHAARALVPYAVSDPAIRESILAQLTDENVSFRQQIVQALPSAIDNTAVREKAIGMLEDDDANVVCSALRVLACQMGATPRIRDIFLRKIQSSEPQVQACAARELLHVMGDDHQIRKVVIDASRDNLALRLTVATYLAGNTNEDACKRLLSWMDDEQENIRRTVTEFLGSRGGEFDDIILQKLDDTSTIVRAAALKALEGRVRGNPAIRRRVLQALVDKEIGVRQSAMKALVPLVESDDEVREAICEHMASNVFPVRIQCAEALARLSHETGPGKAIWPELRQWISIDENNPVNPIRKAIAARLGARLPDDPQLVEWVLGLLRDSRWSSRFGAVCTLLSWPGDVPPDIMEQILASLNDVRGLESYSSRLTAASYLINQNAHHADTIDVCLEALRYGTRPWENIQSSDQIRRQATEVLSRLEPVRYNERAYDALVEVMRNDSNAGVRDSAYKALLRLALLREKEAPGYG